MLDKKEAEVEQLKQREDVKDALKHTATTKQEVTTPVVETRDKLWFGSYILLLIGLGTVYYLLTFEFFGLSENSHATLQRFTRGGLLIVLVIGIAKAIQIYFI